MRLGRLRAIRRDFTLIARLEAEDFGGKNVRRYEATGSMVNKYFNAEASLSFLTHVSVRSIELSIWSLHSTITGTHGRICLRLCAKSKPARSVASWSSTTAATECITYNKATPSIGLSVVATS